MGKGKLAKFSDMDAFENVFQYVYQAWREERKPFEMKGKWHTYFGNHNPIILELGCGKGEYTVAQAQRDPNRNYIGIDIKGARMWTGAKQALEQGLKNVAFIRTGIEMLEAFFEKGEVAEIWLTFPDPQMKKVNKRLTSTNFLNKYRHFMPDGGVINVKTDSNFLFTYTKALTELNQMPTDACCDDIYSNAPLLKEYPNLNIRTYYEQMWLDRGITIKYIRFHLMKNGNLQEPDIEIEEDTYRSYGRNKRQQ